MFKTSFSITFSASDETKILVKGDFILKKIVQLNIRI